MNTPEFDMATNVQQSCLWRERLKAKHPSSEAGILVKSGVLRTKLGNLLSI
jgi:hypothetical protein